MNTSDSIQADRPYQISDRIWWVGHYLENDRFQCHSYLLENGRNSILFDPGSRLTFRHTLKKIEEIIPFSHIRYFVVHHQDPDITGALDIIDSLITRKDARIISHWRAIALLKHLDLSTPIQCVEKMNWTLNAGKRKLDFIFTPYLHFPGAFCSFDSASGTLFSSDLIGGFTEGFSLFAQNESYLESVKLFHEHYMPSREILASAIMKFEKLPLKWILPQHGSIVGNDLIPFILNHLKNLDCGLYLMTRTSTEIKRLSLLQQFMNNFMETMVFHRNFDTTARQLLINIRTIVPAKNLKFLIPKGEQKWLLLEEQNRYQGILYTPPGEILKLLSECQGDNGEIPENIDGEKCLSVFNKLRTVILPLRRIESNTLFALALIGLNEHYRADSETLAILNQISAPLCIALEREIIQQQLDREKQKFYEQSIKDNLTGLYNRTYMNDAVIRLFSLHNRRTYSGIALIMLDLDHFKSVNDTFGHQTGDLVLKETSRVIRECLREGDMAVRVGGEEIAVFLVIENREDGKIVAERIRKAIEELDFTKEMKDRRITVSGGLVFRNMGEDLEDLTQRADENLYKAKESGRNRIVSSD